MPNVPWNVGYCPMCAAWPTLAELRGLERQRWLCCGHCGAGWHFRQQQCLFCSNTEHEKLGYLAAEKQKESRRAVICNCCHHYIKTLTTVTPLSPRELIIQDLTSLELDVAAFEQGYGRPQRPGFPLQLQLVSATSEKQGWLRWK
jgi:FdhE protein